MHAPADVGEAREVQQDDGHGAGGTNQRSARDPAEVSVGSATVQDVQHTFPSGRRHPTCARRSVLRPRAEVAGAAGGIFVQRRDAEKSDQEWRGSLKRHQLLHLIRQHVVQ